MPAASRLHRRLTPLFLAVFGFGVAFWVPVEKLFMFQIGFDAASIGGMAAIYAAAVPIFELPSGVLADRWSRRGVLLLGGLASIISVIIGGLSRNVGAYLVSALFLGIFFAMQSGTFDSVVYDTVLEETGGSDAFERTIARVRVIESIALVASALAGAAIAQVVPLSITYFLTVIPLLGACLALLWFREPRLHQAGEAEPLRRQLTATFRTLLQPGRLRVVVALIIVGALLMQGMIEFGPLWLVALAVPTLVYGPHWAGLTAALGLGGLLGARRWLTRRWAAMMVGVIAVASCVGLALARSAVLVIAAQVLLMLVVVAVSIPATARLHDAVPSSVRASVASGVGTLTWIAFLPFALLMGFLTDRAGPGAAGWLLTVLAVVAAVLVLLVLPRPAPAPVQQVLAEPVAAVETAYPADRFLPPDDPEWPGHWAHPPRSWTGAADQPGLLAAARDVITALPAPLRTVIIMHDVHGRTAPEICEALQITATEQLALLHRARATVRDRLEQQLEDHHGRR